MASVRSLYSKQFLRFKFLNLADTFLATVSRYSTHSSVALYTVDVRTLASSYGRFLNLFKYLVRLLSTSDQPVAKASTYTEQHNIESRGQNIHALS
jgi:hypothetical protein